MSHEKNPPTFYYTGWLIGVLIMIYYNALYNRVVCHPLYNPTNQGPFFHCSYGFVEETTFGNLVGPLYPQAAWPPFGVEFGGDFSM